MWKSTLELAERYLEWLRQRVVFRDPPFSRPVSVLLLPLLIVLIIPLKGSAQTTSATKVPATIGTFKDSNSGAGTYALPISVPPGTAGMAPKIGFVYNSQDSQIADNLLGIGWSLSGLPTIQRCPATVAQDGFKGGINYDSNDRFCLDGQRLMAISGTYGGNGTEYRTEVDSGVKVISSGVAGSGPASFTVRTKAGELIEFGNTADSRIEAQGKASVRVWALNKVQDTSGNYLTVSYTEDSVNGEYRPTRFDYTGNTGLTPNRSVQFFYATRTDAPPLYEGGSLIKTTVRLTNVQTFVGTTLVRDYRLTYENGTATGRSRLKTITECAGDGTCLPATTFGWQEGGTGFATPVVWGTYVCCGSYQLGDFNGDGKTDLLYMDAGTYKVYLSIGSSFAAPTLWGTYSGNGSTQIGDFNGDGKMDLIYADNLQFKVYLSTGSSFAAPTLWGNYICCGSYQLGDFNGDGKTDLIYADNLQFKVYLSTGSSFAAPVVWGTYSGNGSYQLGDFNGDGKTDFVYADNLLFKVYLSTGSSFAAPVVWGTYVCCGSYQLGDFNGDGKTDLLYMDAGTYKVYLSIGSSFTAATLWGTYSGNGSTQIGDFNGDGKMDLIYADNLQFKVYLSTGSSFAAPVVWGTYSGNGSYQLGDFNGDGKTDFVYADNLLFKVYLSNSPYPDLLTSITNSVGGQITVTYKPITDSTVYTKDNDAVYPNMDVQEPLYVVASHTVSDGLGATYTYNYQYGGGKSHLLGRGWLGFRFMRATENATGATTTTFFRQDFPFTGLVSTSEILNSAGLLFNQAVNTWASTNPYTGVSLVNLSRVDSYECDGQPTCIQSAQTFTYDSFGNPTATVHLGDVNITTDDRNEVTDWIVDQTNWLHRPKRTALHEGTTPAGALLRERWLSYDGLAWGLLGTRGLLTEEESRKTATDNQGSANNPVVTHTYDATFGNKTSTTDLLGCVTTTTFESSQTFPATVTRCSNSTTLNFTTSFVYDARFGVVTSQTDPNLKTTTSTYDSFGRRTKVTGPLDTTSTYGTVSHFYLDWGNPSLQRIETFRTEQNGTANYIWTKEYFDGLGRIDKVESEGPGGQTIVTEITFDARGLVDAKSDPHFSTETANWTDFEYDVLGRQTKVTHPDLTFATMSYLLDVITLTDERGKVKKKYLDAYDRLVKVEEFNGAEIYVTTYEYDAAGALTHVANHLGHHTRMKYDLLGRKEAMCDPNMGTSSGITTCTTTTTGAWVYTYDKAGNLLTQKDARPKTLVFTYDLLSRPLTKKEISSSSIFVTWTYDTTQVSPTPTNPIDHPKGRLTKVTESSVTTKFAYDQMGRVSQTQRILLGVTHTMKQSYDALNRVTSETFPDADVATYTYNEAGWLSSVPGYIDSITYNAKGQKTNLQYANGVGTTWTYNNLSSRVTNRTTSGAAGTFQNLTYGYDEIGNITSIADPVYTADRTFQYDDLNRLTQGAGNFGANQAATTCSYLYNAIGNITDKCGITYTYGSAAHPSAVTSRSDGKTYTYDAIGNMLTGAGKTFTWSSQNRLATVNTPGIGTSTYFYDYTNIRVRKDGPFGTTIFPFAGYEIDSHGVITKHIRIGQEIFAAKKGTNKLFYHNDHLGGVNVITNASGLLAQLIEYDPWGKVSREEGAGDSLRRFNGKIQDPETGLLYYGGRYYDPELARWISPDPFIQTMTEPQALNRYSYVLNNPVNYIDPDGFFFKKLFKKLWKTVKKAWKAILSSPFGRIVLAAAFAVASYGAFTWLSGAAYSGTVAAVTGLSAASAQGIMEIPPVRRWLAKAGPGAALGIGLVLNAGFQLAYGAAFTEPTTILDRADATAEQLGKFKSVFEKGVGGTNFEPTVRDFSQVSKFVLNKSGEAVGFIGAQDALIFGAIPGQHSAAVFSKLARNLGVSPLDPSGLYLLAHTSHQTLGQNFLAAGFRGTILNAGIGILRYPSSLVYGVYGGAPAFNPSFYMAGDRE